ncbi:hypothetical protein ACNA4K_23990, partial [Klebsiella pneumoniae]
LKGIKQAGSSMNNLKVSALTVSLLMAAQAPYSTAMGIYLLPVRRQAICETQLLCTILIELKR